MNKWLKYSFLLAISAISISSCQHEQAIPVPAPVNVDLANIAFTQDDIVQNSFGGLGVEWGAYEDTDKLLEDGWDRVIKHMDHLGAARIRLMINYDWFCQNFDNKGNKDKNDDTWTYNFTNKYARNMIDILEYCQTHQIDVALGAWNVIGTLDGTDVWNMMDEVTSDVRWAKITADTLDFLVNKKGFSCIKWFVNSNEPNLTGSSTSSKNYNNTYAKWEQGVLNVRNALDNIGLTNIGIIGGDTTGYDGCKEYLLNIAKSKTMRHKVADYGAHLYLSNIAIDRGNMMADVQSLYSQIKENDPNLGDSIQADIWEAGLLDGKTPLDCQKAIGTTDYAVRMVDYTIQALASGVNGVVYWDFDDAMHFMYSLNTTTPKEWGMFSSLAEASSKMQELRPWYHSSSLLCHLIKKGNKIYSPLQNNNELDNSFRSLATRNDDGSLAGFVGVNAGRTTVTKTFYMDEETSGDKLYIYIFNEESCRFDEEGYLMPSYEIDGSLNKKITLDIPKTTAVVVSNVRL